VTPTTTPLLATTRRSVFVLILVLTETTSALTHLAERRFLENVTAEQHLAAQLLHVPDTLMKAQWEQAFAWAR
jgi:hypothetical protein